MRKEGAASIAGVGESIYRTAPIVVKEGHDVATFSVPNANKIGKSMNCLPS